MTQDQVYELDDIHLGVVYKSQVIEGLSLVLDSIGEFEISPTSEVGKKLSALRIILADIAEDLTTIADRIDRVVPIDERQAA